MHTCGPMARLLNVFMLLGWLGLSLSAEAYQFQKVTRSVLAQRLDQTDVNSATFNQRFFLIEDLVQGNKKFAPVIYFMCSHESCLDTDVPTGVLEIARSIGAWIVGLEQRFRGESQPFIDMSPKALSYLNLKNILHDLATFQHVATEAFNLRGQWIAYGASYGGLMAAYYRSLYPNLVTAAIASSAMIFPALEVPNHDVKSAEVLGAECTRNVREALEFLSSGDANKLADATSLPQISVEDAKLILRMNVTGPAIYDRVPSICGSVAQPSNSRTNLDSILSWMLGKLSTNKNFYIGDPYDFSFDMKEKRKNDGLHQWLWLRATELGLLQTSSGQGTLPTSINLNYYRDLFRRKFGINTLPDPNKTLAPYLKRILNGEEDRILFITYQKDPWFQVQFSAEKTRQFPNSRVWYIENPVGFHSKDFLGLPEDRPLREQIVTFIKKFVPTSLASNVN